MDMKSFFKDAVVPVENIKYIASERFKDEEGNPVEWEIRVLDSEEFEKKVADKAKKKVPSPDNPRATTTITDGTLLLEGLLKEAIVEPNLKSTELQDSWGTVGEIPTLRKMLTIGEFNDLAAAVQQAQGLAVGMEDKIKTAKN
ncbi:MAG: phage tail assembly chaperone [Sporomusa sp.]